MWFACKGPSRDGREEMPVWIIKSMQFQQREIHHSCEQVKNQRLRIVFHENKRSFDARAFSGLSAPLIHAYSFSSVPSLSHGWRTIYLRLRSPSEHWAWSYITWRSFLVQKGTSKAHMLQNEIKLPSVMIVEVMFYIRRKLKSLIMWSMSANYWIFWSLLFYVLPKHG